jgi:carboxypeptidase Taq
MKEKIEQLKNLIREAKDLGFVESVLSWDQSTHMPVKGARARGRQMALLAGLAHERATAPAIGHLLDELEPWAENNLPYDDDDAAMVRAARRDYERETKIPTEFIAEFTEHSARAYQTWAGARPQNDWGKVAPNLEKTLDYSRRLADFFPGYQHLADPLIDFADYGMKAADVRRVFAELRSELVPFIQEISQKEQVDDSCIKQHFPKEDQLKFSQQVSLDFGYDLQRGRLDLTHHPFETTFSVDDVRITTRVKENDLSECMFSVFHETGHALYELGCNPAYESTSLHGGVSAGVHESQSRTWENIVGRSRGFWEHYYPKLQAVFPQQLGSVDLDTFYRAVNIVHPSLIRTDADEVTYNLHPMIRFEIELELLEGALAVRDLPEVWRSRYQEYLGVSSPDDRDGVMQDVHWYGGLIGGSFQGYTLGNILSAQFFEKVLDAHPEIPEEIRQGKFETLHNWLKENIYQYGSKYTAPELIERVTGGGLDVQPLMRYLKKKYGEVYELQ